MTELHRPRLLAVSAYSGTGKTTLLTHVIPLLKKKGLRIGVIKHTHHDMDIDKPGKDSYALRKAGAKQTLVASNQRWALMTETQEAKEVDLYEMVSKMDVDTLDVVLVEGFRHEKVPKIVLSRRGLSKKNAHDLLDSYAIAIASDDDEDRQLPLPWLDINDPQQVADFIEGWIRG
ncbi:molybdopterin-guanine dinucleotide biosynthesis protein MobB [Candidatus Symbiopectobacterium sp. NZEC135]|uniref:molybdopterin-guanine dinucleotide biosynthesis protein MobB n=1 Tax=Candidatus Symbiopectobacterium sp. NZEC135 TaxID=2820471 RepID=UPI0022269A2A|nr:molybdopterin-guanine dinucleotide biosynthesis protein MobB [Candidatus Symbiopectobacterium sp. NZEC135]MCW2480258.1 molybdopterin-guanine dinucleotide biosynthesis protein B [Candidatus Symbiopectobacterium sp. NZEC135]